MGKRVFFWPAYVFAASAGICYYFSEYNAVILFVFGLICLVASVIGQVLITKDEFSAVPYCVIPYAYPLLSLCALYILYYGLEPRYALTACSLAILAPQAADVMAYFGGTLFGKHKLCPSISPKKTVEGSAFSLLGGVLMALILYAIQSVWGGEVQLWPMLSLGLLCGIIGQFGDLFASCIKRAAGIKDFSSVLPGHGGFMDRIDSVVLCAPMVLAFFMILSYFSVKI